MIMPFCSWHSVSRCTIMLECVFQCYWLLLTDIVCSAEISLRSKMLSMKSLQRNQLCGIIWSPSQMTSWTSGENRKSLKASLEIFDGQNSLSPGWADRIPCCKILVLISCLFSHLTPVCVCPYQQRNASKSTCSWIFLRLWFRESVHGQLWLCQVITWRWYEAIISVCGIDYMQQMSNSMHTKDLVWTNIEHLLLCNHQ